MSEGAKLDRVVSIEQAKQMIRAKRKGRKRTVDNLFSKVVRARDGRCLKCGTVEKLQCSHVLPRTHLSIRWDLDNAITLCYRCHIYWWHKNVLEAARWFEETFPGRADELRRKALNPKPVKQSDIDDIYDQLKREA